MKYEIWLTQGQGSVKDGEYKTLRGALNYVAKHVGEGSFGIKCPDGTWHDWDKKKKKKSTVKNTAKKGTYIRRSDDVIKKIALGLYRNEIYWSAGVSNQMLPVVFMPLALMDKKSLQLLKRDKITVLFEDISKAMHMSINGQPIFPSCQLLDKEDAERVFNEVQRIQKVMES